MAAPAKLTEADVKRIRRRVRAGEHQTDLADEFGVNRKTIRRRPDALELAETERVERLAEKRLRRQAAREKRKLFERERDAGVLPPIEPSETSGRRSQQRTSIRDPYFVWLDSRKNLSGRAAAEASGLVRVRLPDDSIRKAAEREELEKGGSRSCRPVLDWAVGRSGVSNLGFPNPVAMRIARMRA